MRCGQRGGKENLARESKEEKFAGGTGCRVEGKPGRECRLGGVSKR